MQKINMAFISMTHSYYGVRIRQLRKNMKLRQEDLAERLNVSIQAVRNWEQHKYAPEPVNIEKLCQFFNIPEWQLLVDPETIVTDLPPKRKIPLLTLEQAYTHDRYMTDASVDFIYDNAQGGGCMFAVRVTEALDSRLRKNDIVFIDPEVKPPQGEYTLISDLNRRTTFFAIYKEFNGTVILTLLPSKEEITITDQFKIIGPVVAGRWGEII